MVSKEASKEIVFSTIRRSAERAPQARTAEMRFLVPDSRPLDRRTFSTSSRFTKHSKIFNPGSGLTTTKMAPGGEKKKNWWRGWQGTTLRIAVGIALSLSLAGMDGGALPIAMSGWDPASYLLWFKDFVNHLLIHWRIYGGAGGGAVGIAYLWLDKKTRKAANDN